MAGGKQVHANLMRAARDGPRLDQRRIRASLHNPKLSFRLFRFGAIKSLLDGERRISYDSPIHDAADLDTTPLTPQAVNIKPCRVGDLRSLFEVYAAVEERGLITYGGGMGELDVGRGQIQLLASLFHAEGPNDTAPSGYNLAAPAADLPSSPLAADPAPTGFRRR
jgi:hypothetical protein